MKYEFAKLEPMVREAAKEDRAAALAFFLMDQDVGVLGKWRGRMRAEDQRALFGVALGKGLIVIDGDIEEVKMLVQIAYGQDWDCAEYFRWGELPKAA